MNKQANYLHSEILKKKVKIKRQPRTVKINTTYYKYYVSNITIILHNLIPFCSEETIRKKRCFMFPIIKIQKGCEKLPTKLRITV